MAGGRIEVAYESTSQEIKTGINDLKSSSGRVVDASSKKYEPLLLDGFMITDKNDTMYDDIGKMIKTVAPNSSPVQHYQALNLIGHENIWMTVSSSFGIILFDTDTLTVVTHAPMTSTDSPLVYSDNKVQVLEDANHFYVTFRLVSNGRVLVLYVFDKETLAFVKRVESEPLQVDVSTWFPSAIIKHSDGFKYLHFVAYDNIAATSTWAFRLIYSGNTLSGISNTYRGNLAHSTGYPIIGIIQEPTFETAMLMILQNGGTTILFKCNVPSLTSYSSLAQGNSYIGAGQPSQPTFPMLINGKRFTFCILGATSQAKKLIIFDTSSALLSHSLANVDSYRMVLFDYKNRNIWFSNNVAARSYLGVEYCEIIMRSITNTDTSNPYFAGPKTYKSPVEVMIMSQAQTVEGLVFNSNSIVKDGIPYVYDQMRTVGIRYFSKQVMASVIAGYREVK